LMMNWMAQMFHKKQRYMRRMKNGSPARFVSGMMVGAMAGAAAGLMFAPKAGKDFRTDLAAKVGQSLGGATQFGENIKKRAQQVQTNIQDTVNQVKNAASATNNPPA
jgi:gas vesicle protein